MWQGKALIAKASILDFLYVIYCFRGASVGLASCEVKKDIKLPEGQADLGFQWRLSWMNIILYIYIIWTLPHDLPTTVFCRLAHAKLLFHLSEIGAPQLTTAHVQTNAKLLDTCFFKNT